MRQNNVSAIIDLNEPSDALLPLTQFRPVGTLPFAGRYRLIDFPLSAISNAGIRDVGMFMPRSARSVQDHVRSGDAWNLDSIRGGIFTFPYVANKDYSDPANRRRYFDDYLTFLRKSDSSYTIVIGARNVDNINVQEVQQFHVEGNNPITVLYKRQLPDKVNANEEALNISDAGDVTTIMKASEITPDPVNHMVPMHMGVYFLRTSLLIDLLQNASQREEFIRLPEILHEALEVYNANGYEYTGFYANINTIKRYFDANMAMLDEANYQALLFSQREIYTKNLNEIPTFFSKGSDVNTSLLGTGCRIEGQANHSVIFRRVIIDRSAKVENSIIMQGSKIGPGSKLNYVILDKGVVIGPHLTIEGTPEKPIIFEKNMSVLRASDIKKGVQH
ncbi:ADP-glucose pyrophosphorylase [Agrilactobacillus composti DSM 18527 = JCM 14202]|uniref:ADP-glucose pyrophosphorylase n=1 Tax=Agrilactobacillus composti DSM 18527 = JCM 14202 TaxID=1423734 RepID=A0A0R1XN80_9LACO|nr:glucose-1-phosphate adenylyltransferase subunit GlgD [Agrilactobacillus composti]KRM31077.1 ADP-glucose pyrophosphorylase [Agrilactobacillus composti DSM 18527 = JCM 14202]